MKFINASVSLINQEPGIEGLFKKIERCSRVCYKSENLTTEGSARKMVYRLIKKGHTAMLEHGIVHLQVPITNFADIWFIADSPYTEFHEGCSGYPHDIYTNLRVLVEKKPKDWERILQEYWVDIEEGKYFTAHFVISRAIANEFVRHRVFSFAQESTRYCNYSKAKFDGGVTFIIPEWFKECNDPYNRMNWENIMGYSEKIYLDLISGGISPENARGVLPLDLKTELVMTGTIDNWKQFLDLRLHEITGKVHPDAKAIAHQFNLLVG